MNLITTICLIFTLGLIGLESERMKPKPYPLGSGDTLMVRTAGYGFCPMNCDIDHFHTGHFTNYDCEEDMCNHITINEEWSNKTYIARMDGIYGIFYVQCMVRLTLYDWSCTCIYTDDNGAR